MLASIASITTMLFEVPTGAIGDKFSRKLSLVIGCILCGLSLFIFILAPNFYVMALGEIVFSIGLTFRSGTESAILYDSLKNNNEVKQYTSIEGQARSYTFIAQAIGSLAAGVLFTYNIYYPFAVSIVFMFIAALIATQFVEPHIEFKNSSQNYKIQIVESFKYVFGHKKVLSIIVFSVVFSYFYRIGFNYFQPYMKEVGIPTIYFGPIFFLFNVVAAFTSRHAQKFLNMTKPRSLMSLCMLLVLSFLLMSVVRIQIGFILILLQQVVRGLRSPVFQKYMNKHIPSEKRATILSIQNLLNALVIALFAPLAGYILDKTNIYLTHFIVGIAMLILVLLANVFMSRSIDRQGKVG